MIQTQENRQLIQETLSNIDQDYLQKEMKIPENEIFNYLTQLIFNLSKEVYPGIFVMPYTGAQCLQEFISKYNRVIIYNWIQGSYSKYSISDLQTLIQALLKNYDQIELLAVSLQLSQIIKFKEYLMPIMLKQLLEFYDANKIQVGHNFYLVALDSKSDLGRFLSLLNHELAYAKLPFLQSANHRNAHDEGRLESQIQLSQSCQHQIQIDFIKFLKNVRFKYPPDNQRKEFRSTHYRKIQGARREERGTFNVYNDFQSFKLLCNLTSQKFERKQFIEFMRQNLDENDTEFNMKVFEKLCVPPTQIEGQQTLAYELIRQLENTKINMRELKENVYKYIFLNLFQIINEERPGWGQMYYKGAFILRKTNPIRKIKKNYVQVYVNPKYYWFDCMKLMLEKFKGSSLRRRKDIDLNIKFRLALYRLLGLLILIEGDFLIGIIQSLDNFQINK